MIKHKRKLMANSIWLLAIVLGTFIIGCGRMPPETFWSWSTEDSTEIQNIVNVWRDTFKTSFEDNFYTISYRADTVRNALVADMKTARLEAHYWPRSFKRTINLDKYKMVDIFTPVKDTTVEVQLVESIAGTIIISLDSITRFDTLAHMYDTTFSYDTITTIEKTFKGTSKRFLYFERDTTSHWKFKKMSGGVRIFIPDISTPPVIGYYSNLPGCTLKTKAETVVVFLKPDTTQYGIQRLYDLDSIASFSASDTVITKMLYYDPTASFGFLHNKNKRYDLLLPNATPRLLEWNAGWNHLMLELVPWEALCKPGDYNAILWSLPIKVVP